MAAGAPEPLNNRVGSVDVACMKTTGSFRVANRPGVEKLLRYAAGASVLTACAASFSVVFVGRAKGGYDTFWDGWLFHIATTLPAVLAGIRAFVDRRLRVAWWLVSAGILSNTVANLIFTYHDQNVVPLPFPAWSDLFYLGSYACFAVALVIITQAETGDISKAVRLDGVIIGLSAGAVAVVLWFQSILAQTGSTFAVVTGLAYPLFDIVFIVIVVSGLAPARFRPKWSSLAFMIGTAAFALGDTIYLNQQAAGEYVSATPLEITWIVGLLLFGLAAWAPTELRAAEGAEVSSRAAVVPGAAATVALGVIALGLSVSVPLLASWLAIASIGAALVRVGLTVRELRRANVAFGQARTDELTGILNRRGFAEELDRCLSSAPNSLSVLVIDLDGFKEINDSLGHQAGDFLLRVIGERFTTALPPDALVARLGGDEFGLAIPGGRVVAERTVAAIQASLERTVLLEGIPVRVGASIGLAEAPAHGTTRSELLRAADVAMYEAKTAQRGSAWYSPDQDPHSRDRLALVEELRSAIEVRAFEMHYQPTVDVRSGRVVGMEALIRWNHPTRGVLQPDSFIPLAERVGLIPAITRAVLDLSIAHLAVLCEKGQELRLSVNISAKDLVDDSLPAYIRSVLQRHDVPASLLTLEITETALSSDSVRAERTLHALRAEGIRISIDDFGVGYSSMSQLLKLPLDELKIDRSFIANLDGDLRAQAILSATVELGRTLGLDIVAEGIESRASLAEVRRRGVDTAQGFFFSKALPSSSFSRYVADHEIGRELALTSAPQGDVDQSV